MGKYSVPIQNRLILQAQVGLTSGQEQWLRFMGRAVPLLIRVQFLIDTGSSRCCLLPSVLARLNPEQSGVTRMETSLATGQAALFWVRLEFPDTKLAAIPELVVARVPLPNSLSAFHGVIGRDLLRRWESFCYLGRRGRLSIRDTPNWLSRWIKR
jgi:hypothetical protein